MPDDSMREKIAAKLVDVLNAVRQSDGYFFNLNVFRNWVTIKMLDDATLPAGYVLVLHEKRYESDDHQDVPNGFVMAVAQAELRGYIKADDDAVTAGKPTAETLRNRMLKDIETAVYNVAYPALGMENDGVMSVKITGVETDDGEIAPYAYLGVILEITYRYGLGQP